MKILKKKNNRSIIAVLFFFIGYSILFSQSRIDKVKLNENSDSLIIGANIKELKFQIPILDSYEKVNVNLNKSNEIILHFSSTHVTTMDFYGKLDENDNLIFNNYLIFSPCQTCEIPEIKTCEGNLNLNINEINDVLIKELMSNYKNCRKLINDGINLSLQDLDKYVNSILFHEKALKQEMISNTIKLQPITKKNQNIYNRIFEKLKKIGFELTDCKFL
jgi:hypothetical protein